MRISTRNFKKSIRNSILLLILLVFSSCGQRSEKAEQTESDLFTGFQNPPAEARPFVRWWWNGNRIEKEEIVRQLDVLHKAGIGGVEINPIAMPEEADDMGIEPLIWNSKEWNEMLRFAALEAQKRGMLTDLIVGSGWPFGGEFLEEDETIQRIIVHQIPCSGEEKLNENLESLYHKAVAALSHSYGVARSYKLVFIRLVPSGIQSTAEILDLTETFHKENRLELEVPSGRFELVYGILQRGNREVMHGAPGAAGPVMNHYEREITRAYLNRLNKISEDTGILLSELIRALFCDSIELDGANWTDGFEELFFETYNYRLEPWFPFIFYDPYTGYSKEDYNPEFADELKRVRYDYNKLLVKTFLENFTKEFQDFCTEKGVLCRYQAYGTPYLMGMMEGNMIADIPESNNWLYSADMDADEWEWNLEHGYMIWNLYAASGGHLSGKRIISNEAMTNTRGVFKTSLEEIKQHDDMNFITGMNHAVLHGYNYSPAQTEFPGWVRYGTYFSERNPWWPYFPKWVDYNARLSYVFQNSDPVKSIAILAPEGDIWSEYGLTRGPFHTQPWYCHRLWEPLSQAGSSCDYIGQNIIREGKKEAGSLTFGPMSYQTILLSGVRSLESKTALALLDFVKNGGKLVAISEVPSHSLSYQNSDENDVVVQRVFAQLKADFPDRFFEVAVPESEDALLSWAMEMLRETGIQKDVEIDSPNKAVYQIHKKAGEKDIWFFVNSSRVKTSAFKAVFPTGEKTPWIWNPEDGTRSVFPFGENRNELNLELTPLQSLLLVFEPGISEPGKPLKKPGEKILTIEGPWEATFKHVNGQTFTRSFQKLEQFGTSPDAQLNTFAGTVTYKTTFSLNQSPKWLQLENVHKGVTEVFLNGKKTGTNWYGKPVFNIENAVKNGENLLEIKVTTVLSNYVMSLENNLTAKRWTRGYTNIPVGPEGVIQLITPKYLE
jgi:hypothetical protein